MDESFGDFLKNRRTALGLTQRQVAEDVGIAPAYLSQLEKGRISLPSADLRRRLAGALAVRHVDILIAAGELWEKELPLLQQGQISERSPEYDSVAPLLEAVDWSDPFAQAVIKNQLEFVLASQRKQRKEASE